MKKINCLLNMINICLGAMKNCDFIGSQVTYFQIKFGKYYFDGDSFGAVNDELQILIPYLAEL